MSEVLRLVGRPSPPPPTESIGAREVVSILFAGLVGSSGLHERLDPESARRFMESYYAAAREAVQSHGGMVTQFLGNGVKAVFGVPRVAENDAIRAARARAPERGSRRRSADWRQSHRSRRVLYARGPRALPRQPGPGAGALRTRDDVRRSRSSAHVRGGLNGEGGRRGLPSGSAQPLVGVRGVRDSGSGCASGHVHVRGSQEHQDAGPGLGAGAVEIGDRSDVGAGPATFLGAAVPGEVKNGQTWI